MPAHDNHNNSSAMTEQRYESRAEESGIDTRRAWVPHSFSAHTPKIFTPFSETSQRCHNSPPFREMSEISVTNSIHSVRISVCAHH